MSPIGFPSVVNPTDTVVINQAGDPALLPSESLQILPPLDLGLNHLSMRPSLTSLHSKEQHPLLLIAASPYRHCLLSPLPCFVFLCRLISWYIFICYNLLWRVSSLRAGAGSVVFTPNA